MKILAMFLASLAAFATLDYSSATTQYEASNNAVGTPGGVRFQNEIGLSYGIEVMETASTLHVWSEIRITAQKRSVHFSNDSENEWSCDQCQGKHLPER